MTYQVPMDISARIDITALATASLCVHNAAIPYGLDGSSFVGAGLAATAEGGVIGSGEVNLCQGHQRLDEPFGLAQAEVKDLLERQDALERSIGIEARATRGLTRVVWRQATRTSAANQIVRLPRCTKAAVSAFQLGTW